MSQFINTKWCIPSIQTFSSLLISFLYPFLIFHCLSPDSTITNLCALIFLSLSYSNLSVDDWLQSYTYKFFSYSFKVKISLSMARNVIFIWLGKKPWHLTSWAVSWLTSGQTTIKPINPELSWQKIGEWDRLCMWPLMQPCAK